MFVTYLTKMPSIIPDSSFEEHTATYDQVVRAVREARVAREARERATPPVMSQSELSTIPLFNPLPERGDKLVFHFPNFTQNYTVETSCCSERTSMNGLIFRELKIHSSRIRFCKQAYGEKASCSGMWPEYTPLPEGRKELARCLLALDWKMAKVGGYTTLNGKRLIVSPLRVKKEETIKKRTNTTIITIDFGSSRTNPAIDPTIDPTIDPAIDPSVSFGKSGSRSAGQTTGQTAEDIYKKLNKKVKTKKQK